MKMKMELLQMLFNIIYCPNYQARNKRQEKAIDDLKAKGLVIENDDFLVRVTDAGREAYESTK